jgi:hypothetical protein
LVLVFGALSLWAVGVGSARAASVTALSAGGQHTCALLAGGAVECWGAGDQGQLGDGLMSGSATPVPVSGISEAIAISAGGQYSCALLAAGTVECWGDDKYSELGDGAATDSPTPVPVPGIGEAAALSAGGIYACVFLSSGPVECWGELNYEGEASSATPAPVSGLSGPAALSAGGFHACALFEVGTVECWGDDSFGELGDGTVSASLTLTPVPVSGIGEAVALSAGGFHSCALLTSGMVECWGADDSGQLGDGQVVEDSPVPVAVVFGSSQSVGAGSSGIPGSESGAGGQPPVPIFGKAATLRPVHGKVLVRLPGRRRFAPLATATSVPLGAVVDTTAGTVELISAAGAATAATESGLFRAGVFRLTQKLAPSQLKGGRRVGFTVLKLVDSPLVGCAGARGAARAASSSHTHHGGGRLWGNAHGNYQTEGADANVTVRGTEWLTEDSCAGTRVKVARGVVSVLDIPRHRTVLVKAPHSYLARRRAGG